MKLPEDITVGTRVRVFIPSTGATVEGEVTVVRPKTVTVKDRSGNFAYYRGSGRMVGSPTHGGAFIEAVL